MIPTLVVGTGLGEASYHVRREDLVRYAGASGDFNVIHWSDRAATAVGLPGVIAHGMLTMALAGRFVADWCGDSTAIVDFGVRFARPVVVPDDDNGAVLRITGEVVEVRTDTVVVALQATTTEGEVLTGARAEVRVSAGGSVGNGSERVPA